MDSTNLTATPNHQEATMATKVYDPRDISPACFNPLTAACDIAACPDAIGQRYPTGQWYIRLGHNGFNLPANNAGGYRTAAAARRALRRCGGR